MTTVLASALLALFYSGQGVLSENFESWGDGAASGWVVQRWGGQSTHGVEPLRGRGGGKCALVFSADGADAAWSWRAKVFPYSKYRLTGWIKAEGVEKPNGQGALINLHSRPERTEAVTGTTDWQEVSLEFDSGPDDSVQINLLLGYFGRAKGRALFDDIKLELVSTRAVKPQVAIDASKTKEPISKYVYGQFIEHLGRCIYGGIWAEMLEDRKFFYLPGTKESPWKVVGNATVRPVTTSPLSGEQSIAIASRTGEGGLEHTGLGLKPATKYVGHLWVRAAKPQWIDLVLYEGDREVHRDVVTFDKAASGFKRFEFEFVSLRGSEDGRLRITCAGEGELAIGAISLMPADNVRGMRADTLKLLKELNSPVYRWPGGNFVSAYDWRDGIGDRDRRPTRKNPAWQGIDSNDFGLHEFMDFCKEVGTEPLVVVNTGFGDANSAAEEVAYVNGVAGRTSPTSPTSLTFWNDQRVKNGQKNPWKVRWWGVGNEMYGDWQHGHMSLNFYTQKHNLFAEKMRAVDPSIKLIGVGAAGQWSEGMLRSCADNLDLLSEHFYTQERPSVPAHVAQMPSQVKRIAEAHRDYRRRLAELKGRDIRVALDEWNYWYGPHVYGELGTVYFQKDALGVAAGLHEMFRNSDLYYMANYAQTVNVIGAIKTTKTKAAFDTTGLVLREYRRLFGALPIAVSGAVEPLDVSAAWTADKRFLTIGVVNPTGQEQNLELSLTGVLLSAGKRHELAASPQAFNTPDKPDVVKWVESAEPAPSGSVKVKPYSVTVYVFAVR